MDPCSCPVVEDFLSTLVSIVSTSSHSPCASTHSKLASGQGLHRKCSARSHQELLSAPVLIIFNLSLLLDTS